MTQAPVSDPGSPQPRRLAGWLVVAALVVVVVVILVLALTGRLSPVPDPTPTPSVPLVQASPAQESQAAADVEATVQALVESFTTATAEAEATLNAIADARARETAAVIAAASTADAQAQATNTASGVTATAQSVEQTSTAVAQAQPTLIATAVPTATPQPPPPPVCDIPVGGIFSVLWIQPDVYQRLGCPTGSAHESWAAEEAFQGGSMLWRESAETVYVLFDDGTWLLSRDEFVEGVDPEYPCGEPSSPPSPRRGFGKVWCTYPSVRDRLGNALEREFGYGMPGGGPAELFQDFQGGMMFQSQRFSAIYALFADGTWRR